MQPVTWCLFSPSVSGRVRAACSEVRDQVASLPRAVCHQAAARHADVHLPQRAGSPGVGHRHDIIPEGSPQGSELTFKFDIIFPHFTTLRAVSSPFLLLARVRHQVKNKRGPASPRHHSNPTRQTIRVYIRARF